MTSFGRIIRVLSWKNWLLIKRKFTPQLFIFFTPIILFFILGFMLKPLIIKHKKINCARPLEDPQSFDQSTKYASEDTCQWPSFPAVLPTSNNKSSISHDITPFRILNPDIDDNSVGCPIGSTVEIVTLVDNLPDGTDAIQIVEDAAAKLEILLKYEENDMPSHEVSARFVKSAEFYQMYNSLTLMNTSQSGCFLGLTFEDSNNLYNFAIRPPFVPGGAVSHSKDQRTWYTEEDRPRVNPIMPTQPRDAGGVTTNPSLVNTNGPGLLGGAPGYAVHGFLALQHAVSLALIDHHTNMTSEGGDYNERASRVVDQIQRLRLNRIPYPQWESNYWPTVLVSGAPWFLLIPLMFGSAQLAKDIVLEKEHRIKAAMMMMGVRMHHHWVAWFIRGFTTFGVSLVIVGIICGVYKIFAADISVLIVFLLLSGAAVVSQTFLISSLFHKGTNAAMACGIGMYLSFLPFQLGIGQSATTGAAIPGDTAQMGTCMLPASCVGVGFFSMAATEVRDSHVSWSNINNRLSPEAIPMSQVIGLLVFDFFWMLALACYIEVVFPGDFGVPKHPLFPIKWMLGAIGLGQKDNDELSAVEEHKENQDHIQPLDANVELGLKTRGLWKIFSGKNSSSKVTAVNNLSLDMVEGQITALLGENGAGKTTTMSMLCGLFPATKGKMEVDGKDTTTHRPYLQKVLGVCPQHDVLWDRLTVAEHLTLFGRLKGVESGSLKSAVDEMIADLGLQEKSNCRTRVLSGGQKRRLSCGIALVGGSSVVILDEPTSGCDPKARRDIWDLLLRHKKGRTILLSTHFMDEADILGDRIAIMSAGRLVASGTSNFLKSAFGTGYSLNIATQLGCSTTDVVEIAKKHTGSAFIKSDMGSELSIQIPRNAACYFPALLRELDASKKVLKIDSFGVTVTTMEEVFLQASRMNAPEELDYQVKGALPKISAGTEDLAPDYKIGREEQPLLGMSVNAAPQKHRHLSPSVGRQLNALVWKRWRKIVTEPIATSCQLLVPILFLIISLSTTTPTYGPIMNSATPTMISMTENTIATDEIEVYSTADGLSFLKNAEKVTGSVDDFVGNWTAGEHSFDDRVRMGLSVDAGVVTAWFNANYYHSAVEAYALAVNYIIANASLTNKDTERLQIQVQNYPMPENAVEQAVASSSGSQGGFPYALTTLFAVTFFGCVAVYIPVEETSVNAKHMQLVSGVGVRTYWCAYFIVDMFLGLVLTGVVVIIGTLGEEPIWDSDGSQAALVLLLSFFPAFILQVYCTSLLFHVPANAVRMILFLNVFLAEIPLIASYILRATDNADVSNSITSAFMWLPAFCMANGIVSISDNYANLQAASKLLKLRDQGINLCSDEQECCNYLALQSDSATFCNPSYFSTDFPGAGGDMIACLVQFIVLVIFLLLFEEKYITRLSAKLADKWATIRGKSQPPTDYSSIDDDVLKEMDRISELSHCDNTTHDVITIDRVSKFFGSKRAVDGVSVGIAPHQCFGLLGVNGAGKTTLFKMLTGDHPIGRGSIQVAGYDVGTKLQNVQQQIGYVPQFDAILGYMTGRELLSFYGSLKGLQRSQIPGVVNHLLNKLNLVKHADKKCKTYSGGNKRKLSVASALVGSPEIILLDEPTTGMDPGSRRFLWNVILGLVQDGCSLVLTTHSMEECEALCTKLTIMVQGQFQCLGSPQHLKDRFGSGYTARIVAGSSAEAPPLSLTLSNFQQQFPMMVIEDQLENTASFKIEGAVALADLFEALERQKISGGISDYSCSQTSLEQIFLRYARTESVSTVGATESNA